MSEDASDQDKAKEVFRHVVALFEDRGLDYAIGGGISTDHWSDGASVINDIDVVIREQDAEQILKDLGDNGYETAAMDHSWLHKAYRDGVTVDLMFELKNGTRFDSEFKEHRAQAELFGTLAYVSSAEDQVASLAATIDRSTVGQHWYNIMDLMANNDLEWDYVIARSQRDPHRMLSIVYFALSENVPVQKGVIDRLQELATAANE